MHVLYAPDRAALTRQTESFDSFMEPRICDLERAIAARVTPDNVPAFRSYVDVCRWPYRRLEYGLAVDILLGELGEGARFLDAGCGVTPLAHVFAARGIEAYGCDFDREAIQALLAIPETELYGTHVEYSTQDITALNFPDEYFDAVACISVLEHIPAPNDQRAITELLRVLKPGGVLVLTVDFSPIRRGIHGGMGYYARRTFHFVRRGDIAAVVRGVRAKRDARAAVGDNGSRPRSPNQCFQTRHLLNDILPLLAGLEPLNHLSYFRNLESVTVEDARRFWNLEPGLFELQGRRDVLPAAIVVRRQPPCGVTA